MNFFSRISALFLLGIFLSSQIIFAQNPKGTNEERLEYIQEQFARFPKTLQSKPLSVAQTYNFLFRSIAIMENVPDSYKYISVKWKGIQPKEQLYGSIQIGIYLGILQNSPLRLDRDRIMNPSEFSRLVSSFFSLPADYFEGQKSITIQYLHTFLRKMYLPVIQESPNSIPPDAQEEFSSIYEYLNQSLYLPQGQIIASGAFLEAAYKGMAAGANDPYTQYLTPSEVESFDTSISGEFSGVGITIQETKEGYIEILETIPYGPAYNAGIQSGDKIIQVDDTKIVPFFPQEKIIPLIRGPIDTFIKLRILRNGKELEFTIERKKIELPVYSSADLGNGDTYISLTTFSEKTANLFHKTIVSDMEKKKNGKIILDLRSNPGGDLNAAIKMLSIFIPRGKVLFEVMSRNGNSTLYSLGSGLEGEVSREIRILINKNSASASEVVTAVLKDYFPEKVRIYGENSYGKGLIQSLISLPSGGVLKMTIAEWKTANSHKSIHKIGITPDYFAPVAITSSDPNFDALVQLARNN